MPSFEQIIVSIVALTICGMLVSMVFVAHRKLDILEANGCPIVMTK